MDSLSVLASLRPQSHTENPHSIIPPTPVLQKLQRTLARQPTQGWYGTLPPTKTTALRDDATVKVRSGGVTSVVTSTSAAAAPTTPGPTTPYAGYSYTYGQQQYRPSPTAASYTPYKPSQYYQSPYLATQQLGQQSYYGQQAYGGGASGQQPYAAYSAWYSQYNAPTPNPSSIAASGSSSGRGTPQPAGSTAVPSYGSFFAAAGTPPPSTTRSPAVANTVLAKSGATGAAAWGAYASGQPSPVTPFSGLRSTQGYQAQTSQIMYQGAYASQQAPTTSATR